MDKIKKYLRTLPKKIAKLLEKEIEDILSGNLERKNILPLSGKDGYYRVRKGKFRIIFLRKGKKIQLVDIGKRSDTTYNF